MDLHTALYFILFFSIAIIAVHPAPLRIVQTDAEASLVVKRSSVRDYTLDRWGTDSSASVVEHSQGEQPGTRQLLIR